MARYNNRHNILISDTIEILRDELRRDVFDGVEVGTRIKLSSSSGVLDEFTEEITYSESSVWVNISGIVDTVSEKDELLGINGRVKVGDTSVIYHYNTISGVFLQNYIDEIELLVPGISGLHHVAGYRVSELAGEPLYLKMALNLMTPRLVGSNFVTYDSVLTRNGDTIVSRSGDTVSPSNRN